MFGRGWPQQILVGDLQGAEGAAIILSLMWVVALLADNLELRRLLSLIIEA